MNHNLSVRALEAIMFASLFTLLACASSSVKDPVGAAIDRNERDTMSIANGPGKTMENLLVGRFPGVSVTRTDGGGLQIRIRGGSNTFYGSDEPLILVDDTPLAEGSRGIVYLNPYDIDKIEVLKNPADIGLYGMRGANGVIKITTKQPAVR